MSTRATIGILEYPMIRHTKGGAVFHYIFFVSFCFLLGTIGHTGPLFCNVLGTDGGSALRVSVQQVGKRGSKMVENITCIW